METTNTETRQRVFQDTVARELNGVWWLMNRKGDGWASHGYRYNTLIEIAQDFAVTIGDKGTDQHGEYIEIKAVR